MMISSPRGGRGGYQEEAEEGRGDMSARDSTDRLRQQQQQQESSGATPGGISWRPEHPSPLKPPNERTEGGAERDPDKVGAGRGGVVGWQKRAAQ